MEGALPYVLSAHETTTIHFSEKRVWSLQAQIQREKNLNFFTLSIKDAVKDKNNV
ncbi:MULTISPECIES: 4Fe-4S ferredoxin [Bacteroides]|uniref:4Fe-4S ferredoxin n=1 Tax=Bacteroides TaxID=816 RepID=UPI00374CC720